MYAGRVSLDEVVVRLTYGEAFVLSDMLSRWERAGTDGTRAFEDEAERRLVQDLTAVFEPVIDEAFANDYAASVERARASLRDPAP
jgi:hypothetical protein